MKNVTIWDIAREAGVGKSTVSRVINGSGYVSQISEQKVRAVMEKYHYQPSAAAQSLSRKESDVIGLILPEINNPFFSGILLGVTSAVERYGYTLVLSSSENTPEKDIRAISAMYRQRVRGLIYTPACDYGDETLYPEMRQQLDQLGCPTVILDRPIQRLECDCVTTDNFSGAYACTEALIQAGHRRIGVVAGNMALFIGRERYQGFRRALENNRLELKEEDVVYGNFDRDITYEKVKALLRQEDYPRAFFLSNNLSEEGFLKAVYELGLRIPDDISFVAFDKMPDQDIYGFPFSHLERNVQEMGEQAAQLLFRRFELPDRPVERVVVASRVVLKGSEKRKS